MSGNPYLVRGGCREFLLQQVWRNRQGVVGICRGLELALLFAAYSQFLADAFNAVNASFDAVLSQVALNAFGTIGLTGALVGGANFHFQPRIFLCPP